ncbi:hypothetical protein F4779DRAFT_466341 [Xylariaceae sp. FL0662B]|nr:hypothetical protein F4779DRAFT_466341 [Xylariaceae sp. FL0662B]
MRCDIVREGNFVRVERGRRAKGNLKKDWAGPEAWKQQARQRWIPHGRRGSSLVSTTKYSRYFFFSLSSFFLNSFFTLFSLLLFSSFQDRQIYRAKWLILNFLLPYLPTFSPYTRHTYIHIHTHLYTHTYTRIDHSLHLNTYIP